MKTAVVLFAYKRPEYLKKALASHTRVEGLEYYAFVDKSEMQNDIVNMISHSEHYDYIIPRNENFGLNKNIVRGITDIFATTLYDAVIVLEDDLRISPDAIQYLHYQLWRLQDYKHFSSVSLYKGEIFSEAFRCWGWGTWKDRWDLIKDKIDINGKSWDLQVNELFREKKLYCHCSPISRVKHIGTNGVHYKWYSQFGMRPILRRFGWVD